MATSDTIKNSWHLLKIKSDDASFATCLLNGHLKIFYIHTVLEIKNLKLM